VAFESSDKIVFRQSNLESSLSNLRKTINDLSMLKLQTDMKTMSTLIDRQDRDLDLIEAEYKTEVKDLTNLTGQLYSLSEIDSTGKGSDIANLQYNSSLQGLKNIYNDGEQKKQTYNNALNNIRKKATDSKTISSFYEGKGHSFEGGSVKEAWDVGDFSDKELDKYLKSVGLEHVDKDRFIQGAITQGKLKSSETINKLNLGLLNEEIKKRQIAYYKQKGEPKAVDLSEEMLQHFQGSYQTSKIQSGLIGVNNLETERENLTRPMFNSDKEFQQALAESSAGIEKEKRSIGALYAEAVGEGNLVRDKNYAVTQVAGNYYKDYITMLALGQPKTMPGVGVLTEGSHDTYLNELTKSYEYNQSLTGQAKSNHLRTAQAIFGFTTDFKTHYGQTALYLERDIVNELIDNNLIENNGDNPNSGFQSIFNIMGMSDNDNAGE